MTTFNPNSLLQKAFKIYFIKRTRHPLTVGLVLPLLAPPASVPAPPVEGPLPEAGPADTRATCAT